jgi:hypothetical protein
MPLIHCSRAHLLRRRFSQHHWRRRAWSLGYVHAMSGRPAEGLESVREAHAAMDSMRYLLFRPLILVHLGEASLLVGVASAAIVAKEDRMKSPRARYLTMH